MNTSRYIWVGSPPRTCQERMRVLERCGIWFCGAVMKNSSAPAVQSVSRHAALEANTVHSGSDRQTSLMQWNHQCEKKWSNGWNGRILGAPRLVFDRKRRVTTVRDRKRG